MIPQLYDCFQHWGNQTIWIYSDPHFGDKELAAAYKNRPSDENHIKRLNSYIGKKDTLIILGDIGDLSCVAKLKGYKVLIAGNHDNGISKYKAYFDEVYGGPLIIEPRLILSHEPVSIPGMFNIHGHNHSDQDPSTKNSLNVCSDVSEYTPLHLNRFLKTGGLKNTEGIHRITIDKISSKKDYKCGRFAILNNKEYCVSRNFTAYPTSCKGNYDNCELVDPIYKPLDY